MAEAKGPEGFKKHVSDRNLRDKEYGLDAPKSWLQGRAERILKELIQKEAKVVFTMNERNEQTRLGYFMVSRGMGKWGLLLSPKSGSQYELWYIDYWGHGKDEKGTLNFVSLDFTDPRFKLVARCLEQKVANDLTFPRRKTGDVADTKKVAILIKNATGINITSIDDEADFTGGKLPPLESLIKKE